MKLAIIQMRCSASKKENLEKAIHFIQKASKKRAKIVLFPELFEHRYFCKVKKTTYFALASKVEKNTMIKKMQKLAYKYDMVIPISFFEKSKGKFYNSVAVIDADGRVLGVYRKTHIPCGVGYEEKYYFEKGDTGFKVWHTRYGKIGIGICWDQWFCETVRCFALRGAELILFPSAIGSEPQYPKWDSAPHWKRTIQGHAAANLTPIAVANRVGKETDEGCSIQFYGQSFFTDGFGEIKKELSKNTPQLTIVDIDLKKMQNNRKFWNIFKDRRVDLYKEITKKI